MVHHVWSPGLSIDQLPTSLWQTAVWVQCRVFRATSTPSRVRTVVTVIRFCEDEHWIVAGAKTTSTYRNGAPASSAQAALSERAAPAPPTMTDAARPLAIATRS